MLLMFHNLLWKNLNELSDQPNILAQESYFIRIICYLVIRKYDFVQVWNLQHKNIMRIKVVILNIPIYFLKTIHITEEIKLYHSYLKLIEWIREKSTANFNTPVREGKKKKHELTQTLNRVLGTAYPECGVSLLLAKPWHYNCALLPESYLPHLGGKY